MVCFILLILVISYLLKGIFLDHKIKGISLEDDPITFWAASAIVLSFISIFILILKQESLSTMMVQIIIVLIAIVIIASLFIMCYRTFFRKASPITDISLGIGSIIINALFLYCGEIPGRSGPPLKRVDHPYIFWVIIGFIFLFTVMSFARVIFYYLRPEAFSTDDNAGRNE